MFVDEINIAFPILLVNRESDIFMENPIFYALIDKRKPTTGVGWVRRVVFDFYLLLITLLLASLASLRALRVFSSIDISFKS
ncbi:hypothetical protein E2540_09135, partial [Acinetobacter baumannii]